MMRVRSRTLIPASVVLRLLILKHIRNWSYGVLEREVRANLVYRDFTRVGGAKTPDAKTMGRWGVALAGDVIKQIHIRMVTMAQSHGLTEGRRCSSRRRKTKAKALRPDVPVIISGCSNPRPPFRRRRDRSIDFARNATKSTKVVSSNDNLKWYRHQ